MKNGWRKWLLLGVWMIAFASMAQEPSRGLSWREDFAGGMSTSFYDGEEGGVVTVRLTNYADGGMLLQRITPKGDKKLLELKREGVDLVYGLSDPELSGDPNHNPFFMLPMVFAPTIFALEDTYPQGYATVSGEWETSSGALKDGGNAFWEMQARRVERDGKTIVEVEMTISPPQEETSTGNNGSHLKPIKFTGTWTRQREPALPDSFDLTGWQGQPEQYAGVRTLGELRRMMAAQREMPAKPEAVQAE